MATNPVNLVDAIADVVPRYARNRSAVLRFGKVTVAPASGLATVLVSGATIQCNYMAGFTLAVNDWVLVLNDSDRWIVTGKVIPSTGLAGALAVSGALAVTGNTTVGGTLAVTGNTTVGGTLAVTGDYDDIDPVISRGASNGWTWKKYQDGQSVAYGKHTGTFVMTTTSGNLWYTAAGDEVQPPAYPAGLFNAVPINIQITTNHWSVTHIAPYGINNMGTATTPPAVAGFRGASGTTTGAQYCMLVVGTWK